DAPFVDQLADELADRVPDVGRVRLLVQCDDARATDDPSDRPPDGDGAKVSGSGGLASSRDSGSNGRTLSGGGSYGDGGRAPAASPDRGSSVAVAEATVEDDTDDYMEMIARRAKE